MTKDASNGAFLSLVQALVTDDAGAVSQLLAASPSLVRACFDGDAFDRPVKERYLAEIEHYMYVGDTALHVAAAARRADVVRHLISRGADARARNRRGAEPLHYAADGMPGSRSWNPGAQTLIIARLVAAGADPNAVDKSGVTPLHRAVRTRCAGAVKALLERGADARLANGNGSMPMQLALKTTGRGGSGSLEARAQQAEIVRLLQQYL